jgi:alpha-tubulin suppressor-like RCC1 family protein
MTDVRVRSVAAGLEHSLALGWDGRVYAWGKNEFGQLGQGDRLTKPAPTLVAGLAGVCVIAATFDHSLAVTQSGAVFGWGRGLLQLPSDEFDVVGGSLRPVLDEGFGGVRVRRVCAGMFVAAAIGEAGELFSWGLGVQRRLGHGDSENQPSPKRVEALRGVWVSSIALGHGHALALTEDGLVYAWGTNERRTVLGNPDVECELLPKPVEALRACAWVASLLRAAAATQWRTRASCGRVDFTARI